MALPARVDRSRSSHPLEVVRNDLNMLNRFFGLGRNLFDDAGDSELDLLGSYGVDIREDKDHIYIDADLPGFRKEDVNISLDKGMLTITAEHREEISAPSPPGPQQGQEQQKQDGKPEQQQQQNQKGASSQQEPANYLLRERRIQRFVRSFTLPPTVDEQSVQAKLEDGVLHITLNKREDAKPKRIEVA
jgi:HSP20 family protein